MLLYVTFMIYAFVRGTFEGLPHAPGGAGGQATPRAGG